MVVSLPRSAFKDCNASTNILILQKCIPPEGYAIFYSGIEDELETSLIKIRDRFSDFVKGERIKPGYLSPAWCNTITQKQFVETEREDADYWHPRYTSNIEILNKLNYELLPLGELIEDILQGDVLRTNRGDEYISEKKGIAFISVSNVMKDGSGVDWSDIKFINKEHYERIKRSEPKEGDLLVVRSGEGSIGKIVPFIPIPKYEKYGITGHINRVILKKKVNAFYLALFLKTKFGNLQIKREETGTSGQTEFTQKSVKKIIIPIIPKNFQDVIKKNYIYFYNIHLERVALKHEYMNKGKKNKIHLDEIEKKLSVLSEMMIQNLESFLLQETNSINILK